MTTANYFNAKLADLDLNYFDEEDALNHFVEIIEELSSTKAYLEFEDIYREDFDDMPLSVQIADRYLTQVVPDLGIEPGDFGAEDYYDAASILD